MTTSPAITDSSHKIEIIGAFRVRLEQIAKAITACERRNASDDDLRLYHGHAKAALDTLEALVDWNLAQHVRGVYCRALEAGRIGAPGTGLPGDNDTGASAALRAAP